MANEQNEIEDAAKDERDELQIEEDSPYWNYLVELMIEQGYEAVEDAVARIKQKMIDGDYD